MKITYGANNAGCYVDNCRGIYMVDQIVEIANRHGANIRHDCNPTDCAAKARQVRQLGPDTADDGSLTVYSRCDFADEYWDEATAYMTDHYAVTGHYWGFADHSGDWGLWEIEDEDAPTPERKKFAHALSERTGLDIDPLDIRVEGHWLFYRNIDFPLEIECYRLPLPICAEPWTDIPLNDSPFESTNTDAVSKAIKKLDKEYADDVDDLPDSLPLGRTTTYPKKPDIFNGSVEEWQALIKRARATRGSTGDDVDDLPDSLPLGRTTAIFFKPRKKLVNKADAD